jgi:hypothetical protein
VPFGPQRANNTLPPESSSGAQPELERLCDVVTPSRVRISKDAKVRAVTIAVIAVAALVAIGRKAGWQLPDINARASAPSAGQSGSKPQDVIYRMLDAASQADTDAYIGCYSGSLRRRLEQSREEMTAPGFARYLARTSEPIKGIAVSEPTVVSENEVEVRVEFVYQDRNESQQFFLENSTGEWKVTRVDGAERVATPIPYGTPVF